ncbi:hypothetical protein ACFYVR_22470 [Rhodococcus sp. NPDC003318]|uniref:hypothetical protein n=1 Tax=Rhodococcus sp. NPDC003318 TaxID=3364503 RepID=UPI00369FD83A
MNQPEQPQGQWPPPGQWPQWPQEQGPQGQGPQWPQEQGPQGQGPQGQPGPWPPQGMPPGAPRPPAAPEPPVDVVTAFQLLCGVAVLGVVNLIATLLAIYADRDTFVDQLLADVAAQDPSLEISRSTVESMLAVGLGLTGLVGLGVTGLYMLFAFKMRAGRNWARMLVTMLGVIMVFSAIPALFGLGGGGAAMLVSGAAAILQAVLVVGAIVLMHRSESNKYFLPALRNHDG